MLEGAQVWSMIISITFSSMNICYNRSSSHKTSQDQVTSYSHVYFQTYGSYFYVASWYVSNVSIIYEAFMLYYYVFWMILGFIIHFYITFGTNLLTGGPAHIAVLLLVSVFRRKGISNGVQTEWNLRERDFSEQTWSRGLGVDVKKRTRCPWGRWHAYPPGRALPPRGPLVAPWRISSSYIYTNIA